MSKLSHMKSLSLILNCLRLSIFLVGLSLISGCISLPARYDLPGHRGVESGRGIGEDRELRPVRMTLGDDLRAVRSPRGLFPGGWWPTLWVEDKTVARVEPLDGSWHKGSRLVAVGPGSTKAYYVSAIEKQRLNEGEVDEYLASAMERRRWFIIEVESGN